MPQVIDFDRIRADRAGAVVLNGTQHLVRQISAASLALIAGATADNYLATAVTLVERLVPTLSEADRADLSIGEIEAIIGLASADVNAVRKIDPNYQEPDPNGNGPATAPTSPA